MSAIPKPVKTSVRDRVSKEEWQTRVDLAAAYQLAHFYKWTDLIYTHFSARVPGTEDFLINPYGLMFDEITASTLVKIDLEGKILDDPLDMGVNEAGFVIHSCVHKARPEINCVIHTHTRAGVAVSAMKCGLLPISQHAMMVQADVAYHDYEGIALYMDEQDAHGARPRKHRQGDDPAQPRPARARAHGTGSFRGDVLPRLRLPDPDRRVLGRHAERAAHVGSGGANLQRAVQPAEPPRGLQGLARAAAHARAPRRQVRGIDRQDRPQVKAKMA